MIPRRFTGNYNFHDALLPVVRRYYIHPIYLSIPSLPGGDCSLLSRQFPTIPHVPRLITSRANASVKETEGGRKRERESETEGALEGGRERGRKKERERERKGKKGREIAEGGLADVARTGEWPVARLAPDEMRLIPKSRRGRNELDGLWALTARGLTRCRPTGAPTCLSSQRGTLEPPTHRLYTFFPFPLLFFHHHFPGVGQPPPPPRLARNPLPPPMSDPICNGVSARRRQMLLLLLLLFPSIVEIC